MILAPYRQLGTQWPQVTYLSPKEVCDPPSQPALHVSPSGDLRLHWSQMTPHLNPKERGPPNPPSQPALLVNSPGDLRLHWPQMTHVDPKELCDPPKSTSTPGKPIWRSEAPHTLTPTFPRRPLEKCSPPSPHGTCSPGQLILIFA